MKPNIILINCDDLGYGDIEPFGSVKNSTPYLNKMAQKGTVFTSAYASSPICSPSRAGLMTGCYPMRISLNKVLFPGEKVGLNPNEYTMPQMFSDNGYKTKIIGKWHLGDQKEFLPCSFGFDDYFGIPYSNDMGRQIGDEKDHEKNHPPLPLIRGFEVIEEQPDQCSLTERYTEEAVKFIRENKEENFFLYLAHMHVHLPLYATKRFVDESKNGDFGACVAETDWSCGVIMKELERLGLEENTLVIFTSDNGSNGRSGSSNYPLKGTKFTSWEGGLRIPFIAIWKNHIKEGERCDDMISQLDLLPTFASIIGAQSEFKNPIDGIDVSETLLEGKPVRDEFAYFVIRKDTPEDGGFSSLEAVRKGDHKLYITRRPYYDVPPTNVNELYNLKQDIGEENNIYSQNPDIVSELKAIADKYITKFGDATNNILGNEVRSIGYTDNALPMTEYSEDHPYIISLYDKNDRG